MTRLADIRPLPAGRVAVLAEYPYYRAEPSAWQGNLQALRELGVTVITAYVPWRLHELDTGGHDFTGRTHPQRDVVRFVRAVAEAGLKVILKPGPFIHAEVRLGGLPERVTKMTPRKSAYETVITDEDAPVPSSYDPEFAAAAAEWLRSVRKHVIDDLAHPNGPVIAMQIGNEGVFSDLHKPIDADDFSAPALAAHSKWLGRAVKLPADSMARENWGRWSGNGTRSVLTAYMAAVGDALPVTATVPLPGLPGSSRLPETWLVRAAEAIPADAIAGNTSWTGNAVFSDDALAALWLGMRFARTDTIEDNWGFTWTDETYATPAVPLYHSLLGLAFGSSTASVYTACTTHHWAPVIAPDPDGVLREGGNPTFFDPPYAPGAPLDESGRLQPNAEALRALTTFTGWFGDVLRTVSPEPDVLLVTDPATVAASAWPTCSDLPAPLSVATTAATQLLLRGTEVDVVRPGDTALTDGKPRSWLVVGGRAMRRELQEQLAAACARGDRTVVVGPVPEHDENSATCTVLADALTDSAMCVPIGDDRATSASAVLAAVSEGTAANGAVLMLSRRDPGSGTTVLYLFCRADEAVRHECRAGGVDVTVTLAPRGVAVLVVKANGVQGFLMNRGTAGPEFSPELRVDDEDVPARLLVARRERSGWRN